MDLSDDTTQPILRKSPTVAALLSGAFEPVLGSPKFTKSFLAPSPPWVVSPLFTSLTALSPALMPSLLTVMSLASGALTVNPSPSILVVTSFGASPFLNSAEVNPLRVLSRENVKFLPVRLTLKFLPASSSNALSAPMVSPSSSAVSAVTSVLEFLDFAFQATKFLILVSPASVRLLRFLSALSPTESILALVSALILTVTLSSDAAVSMPSSPLILNFNPSALFKFWLAVSLLLSPPNLMLLLATALNWLPLIASLESALTAPSATLVIFLLAMSMPFSLVTMPPTLVLVKPVKFFASLNRMVSSLS